MLNSILTIAGLTFREAVRRRIALAAFVLGLAFVALFNAGLYFILVEWAQDYPDGGAQQALILRGVMNALGVAGMYAINFLALALGALLAADTLAGEIGSGAIQSIVTKPIARWHVVVGKWLGFALMLAIYLALTTTGVVVGLQVQADYLVPGLERGIPLMYLVSLVVMSVTLMCSSRLSALATGGVIFGLYGLGFIGSMVEQIGSTLGNATAVDIGILTSLLVPTEAIWRRAAFEMSSPITQAVGMMTPFSGFGPAPSPLMIGYGVVYAAAALWIGANWFAQRDL
ncbi:MAG TPA: ABC transporter permease subunit [Anaerolineales bacterium]|nr:ABC transporter permease subunit [Anaerolineales bacterium]